ncbi:ABC transporter ATP-binding protein [Ktedonobacter robiniae]|uniref:ABC transporter ATP-binding protein n=1 Tax=Ktedonobacter robiniae TaxID=2778365 RepID=A0ABQ3UGJ5_9CHLR|nr:ABC transporter ATP-binding protein [Ktedonobacter robiniae]GHO51829.1 ABC transporter ATP-binding protein [Ktedonobacter robiniae]
MKKIEKLVIKGMTRRFGDATALHDFNLEIAGGQFITLLGPSGCGKSTALNCLAGLLELTEGEILLNGAPVQHLPAEKRGFGMVFQNYALFPHLTTQRNISYGLEIRRVPRAEREQRVRKALNMVHLQDFGKRYPAQMSGGQQQRLAIARTIVLEPSLLLLDEPLSNLDANLRNEMRIEIKRLHTELGLTTVYVTHDQSEAMSLSDKVVVMRQGRIEQIGTPQEIYNRPQSLFVARFMGYLNQFPGTVIGRDGEYWLIQTASGEQFTASSTVAESINWQTGQRVLACIRPDETLADPLPAENHVQGHVRLVEYVGRAYEILVQLADERGTQLLVHSAHAPEIGTPLTFGVQPERLLLFPDDEMTTGHTSAEQDLVDVAAMRVER